MRSSEESTRNDLSSHQIFDKTNDLWAMLPVRCFSCNELIGDRWNEYMRQRAQNKSGKACLDSVQLPRMCCRRMILTHVAIIDDMTDFSNENHVLDECNTRLSRLVAHERTVPCE